MSDYLFSSESVSEGHPDKIADQISDALTDAILAQGPRTRAACETLVKDNRIVLAGEIRADSPIDADGIARQVVRDIGYNRDDLGFYADTCDILNLLGRQSPDIAAGVDHDGSDLGAGDQGIMFGFACDETESMMPLPIDLAHRLVRRAADLRKSGALAWLRPDSKSQVSVHYQNGAPAKSAGGGFFHPARPRH